MIGFWVSIQVKKKARRERRALYIDITKASSRDGRFVAPPDVI